MPPWSVGMDLQSLHLVLARKVSALHTLKARLISDELKPMPSLAQSWCTSASRTTLSSAASVQSCVDDVGVLLVSEIPRASRPSRKLSSVLRRSEISSPVVAMKWTSLYAGPPVTEPRKLEGGGTA